MHIELNMKSWGKKELGVDWVVQSSALFGEPKVIHFVKNVEWKPRMMTDKW